jgi:hypothetical protein
MPSGFWFASMRVFLDQMLQLLELGESGMEAMHEAELAIKEGRTEVAGIGYNDSILL